MAPTDRKISKGKRQAGKEKLRSIMEAASALTSLGDDDSTSSRPHSPELLPSEQLLTEEVAVCPQMPNKRYIPDHKKPDAALTFPEKLMNLMRFADKQGDDYCIAWLPDGKSFVIRNADDFTRHVLPSFFKATKFSSFTRKLYRWGFRQVNRGIGPDDPIVFGNEHFQRDDAELMAKMSSITAAGTRKAEANDEIQAGVKRRLESPSLEEQDHKRILLDHLLQQKAAALLTQANPTLHTLANPAVATALASALHPTVGLGLSGALGGGLPALLNKHHDILGHQRNPLFGNLGAASQIQTAASTAEIVNAAICALRFAS